MGEALLHELAHRMALAGREHIIAGLILLQHQPHSLDEIARVPPVALGVEIAEEQLRLQPVLDRCHSARDLAGDESFAAQRAFVIEQDPARGMHAVGLAIIDRDPMGIKLGRGVGRAWVERGRLLLRDLLHLAEQFRGGGLIEAGLPFPAENADGLEQAQRSEPVRVGGVFRRLERDLHMRLRREIVDLVGLRLLHDADDVGGVGQVAIVQMK